MSYVNKEKVTLTTDVSGDAIGYTKVVNGRVAGIQYVKDDFDAGVDFTITSEATGRNIWTEADVNASVDKMPRGRVHNTDGTDSAFDDHIALAEDRVKIVIANGGDTKSGTFHVTIN